MEGRGRQRLMERSGIYTVNTSPNCTVVLLDDEHRSARKRLWACPPIPQPLPQESSAHTPPELPILSPVKAKIHTISLHLLVLAASSLCSRHSELPAMRGRASGNRPGISYPGLGWHVASSFTSSHLCSPISTCQRHPVMTSVLNCNPGLSHPSFISLALFSLHTIWHITYVCDFCTSLKSAYTSLEGKFHEGRNFYGIPSAQNNTRHRVEERKRQRKKEQLWSQIVLNHIWCKMHQITSSRNF